jgi:hypothetical protein
MEYTDRVFKSHLILTEFREVDCWYIVAIPAMAKRTRNEKGVVVQGMEKFSIFRV